MKRGCARAFDAEKAIVQATRLRLVDHDMLKERRVDGEEAAVYNRDAQLNM